MDKRYGCDYCDAEFDTVPERARHESKHRGTLNYEPPQASELYLKCLEEARAHHLTSKTYSGKFLRPHAPVIRQLIDELAVKSILDYGCGKGEQYRWVSHGGPDQSIPEGETLESYWGCGEVFKYDPAYPPYATKPDRPFDLVLCTHVLGSIPIVDLGWVLDELFDYSSRAVYIAEKVGPVKKRVFSEPDKMPRWSAAQWRERILEQMQRWGSSRPKVWFASREKTATGVISEGGWL